MRAGEAWTVVLVDGSEPTFEKRGAPLGLAIQSLRPKGYTRESFAEKKANPLDEARLATLKEFVAGAMKTLDTPGVGLAFIDALPAGEAQQLLVQRRAAVIAQVEAFEQVPAHAGSHQLLIDHQLHYLRSELAWLNLVIRRVRTKARAHH